MNGHADDECKRARNQYDLSYPAGMWTGKWSTNSPAVKEEKSVPSLHNPLGDLTSQAAGGPGHSQSPSNTGSPATIGSPYPPSFPDGVVFTNTTTTSADLLYDSINMTQAYPTGLTTSLGELHTLTSSLVCMRTKNLL